MCRLRNIAVGVWQTDRRSDKVIPMCRYASQATQKLHRIVWKTKFYKMQITPGKVGQALQNWNLICIKSKYILIPNFNWISQKAAEKNLENWILAKGNNSCKSKWSVTKPNLICIMSRQIYVQNFKSISQKTTEKSLENWVDGQSDRRGGNL